VNRAGSRIIIIVFGVLASAGTARAEYPFKGGTEVVDGESRWAYKLERLPSRDCSLRGDKRKLVLGFGASRERREDHKDCVKSKILVRNDSPRTAICRVNATLPQPDDARDTVIGGERVLVSGETANMADTIGSKASSPVDLSARCWAYPENYVKPVVADGCKFSAIMANPGSYYPWNAGRKKERGEVVLETVADPVTGKFRDTRMGVSSGFWELDMAALMVLRFSIVTASTCPDQRYAVKVKFMTPRDAAAKAKERAEAKARDAGSEAQAEGS
jgi:hypothetical protein